MRRRGFICNKELPASSQRDSLKGRFSFRADIISRLNNIFRVLQKPFFSPETASEQANGACFQALKFILPPKAVATPPFHVDSLTHTQLNAGLILCVCVFRQRSHKLAIRGINKTLKRTLRRKRKMCEKEDVD